MSVKARLRIFRACVLFVLLYWSETWSFTIRQKQRITSFYNRCLPTIFGNLRDRLSNETLLDITGQPPVENIIRGNRLRWFEHVNRGKIRDVWPLITKKAMFAYFHGEKRLTNMVRSKLCEDKVLKDIGDLHIGNWRRTALERINRDVHVKPLHTNIKNIVNEYKQSAAQKRRAELDASTGVIKRQVTEILVKKNNQYKCPGCRKSFKPQGVTYHTNLYIKAKTYCNQNKID